jgi:hypothetical protein
MIDLSYYNIVKGDIDFENCLVEEHQMIWATPYYNPTMRYRVCIRIIASWPFVSVTIDIHTDFFVHLAIPANVL